MSGVRVPAPPPFPLPSRARLRRLEPILRRALDGPCEIAPGARMLVAVSGGADSTALLVGLHSLARERGLRLVAAHLHHGLRGAEADADQEFARALCRALEVPYVTARWNARRRMRRRGLSGEAGLRTLRREFLARAARRAGCDAIATAHHADDQLETLLLRLGRGTGLPGLAAMRPRRSGWVKPLLEATRDEIEADLRGGGWPWREDRSNRADEWTRNRVRHAAIPALCAALRPGAALAKARSDLARNAVRAAAEAGGALAFLESLADDALSGGPRIQPGEPGLDSRKVAAYPFTARRMVLRRLWERVAGPALGLTRGHLDSLSRLITAPHGGAVVHLPGGWIGERDREWLRLRRATREARPPVLLPVPGRATWDRGIVDGRWTTGARARRSLGARRPGEEFFAGSGLRGGLTLRGGAADESFVPFGRTRPVRLGRFLGDQRVARDVKTNPTVLADAGGILWVVGVRRSARAPVTPTTRKVLRVHAERT